MGPEPVEQPAVAVAGGGPVDAAHVLAPVVVAHQAPGLVVHLSPLGPGVHLDANPLEVDRDDLGVVLLRLAGRRHHAEVSLVDHHQPGPVTAHLDAVSRLGELLGLPGGQVEVFERGALRLVLDPRPVVAEHALQRA